MKKLFGLILITFSVSFFLGRNIMSDEKLPFDRYFKFDRSKMVGFKPGLLTLDSVRLPEGKNLLGTNGHLGWPVAHVIDDTIILVYHRKPSHWGSPFKADKYTSTAVTCRSEDGGKTWSEPVDMKKLVKTKTKGCKLGFGNAIGVTPDKTVVLVTSYGVFTSKDKGKSWEHLPGAFGEEQLKGPRTNNGPRIAYHPAHGLILPGHTGAGKDSNKLPQTSETLWLRYSKDKGRTWTEKSQKLPPFARAVEPTALVYDNGLYIVARSHGGFNEKDKTWHYVQAYSETGVPPLTAKTTSIPCTHTRTNKWHGPWSQDTVDLSYNPVTKRFEVIATNRNGGGPDHLHDGSGMSLNLWSLDPEDFKSGKSEWKFEGTLIARKGDMGKDSYDGMHPGAAVICPKENVQRVFIYCGFGNYRYVKDRSKPASIAGVFMVTRTLDTPKLSEFLEK